MRLSLYMVTGALLAYGVTALHLGPDSIQDLSQLDNEIMGSEADIDLS